MSLHLETVRIGAGHMVAVVTSKPHTWCATEEEGVWLCAACAFRKEGRAPGKKPHHGQCPDAPVLRHEPGCAPVHPEHGTLLSYADARKAYATAGQPFDMRTYVAVTSLRGYWRPWYAAPQEVGK